MLNEKLGIQKFCTVRNMNWTGEVMHGEFDGTYYVLEDGDCYLPETLLRYEVEYLDNDPRVPNLWMAASGGAAHTPKKMVEIIRGDRPESSNNSEADKAVPDVLNKVEIALGRGLEPMSELFQLQGMEQFQFAVSEPYSSPHSKVFSLIAAR